MVFLRLPSPAVSSLTLPSTIRRMAMCGLESATFSTLAVTAMASVTSFLRNFRRAGTLAKRFSTITDVPVEQPCSQRDTISPQCASSSVPNSAASVLEMMRRSETDAIAASASPRKPSVRMPSKSSALRILLVAWRRMAVGMSSGSMPQPLSVTRIKVTPPFWISTVMRVAPASMEFSISSLMTDAGRSTTSPAAIRFATAKGKTLILGIPILLSS